VGQVLAVAALALMSGFIGGCAAIAGLTPYSNGDCNGGDCDGGTDATADGPTGDAMAAPDGTSDGDATGADATDGSLSQDVVAVDVTHDVGSNDALASCGMCPNGCTTHDNGVGQSYYDCNPLYSANNPWTETAAFEACAALTGQAAKCTSGWKCGTSLSICSSGSVVCDCWEYSGSLSGHVNASGNCDCVLSTDPTWD
jgi:hypothetical protein